ncbi:MAG: ABC transporter permease [Verrucomicrobiales bacterium]
MKPSRWPFFLTVLALVFLHMPIVFLVINSFNTSKYSASWEGFTWHWYERLFHRQNRDLWEALRRSLIIATLSSVASMVLGTFAACALHVFRSRLQKIHFALVYLPIVVPDILMGISLALPFALVKFPSGMPAIVVAHTTFCLSFVALVVLARLQDFDRNLIDAARDLGAGWLRTVLSVVVPILAPGILAGGLLAFTLSLDDYVITFFVKGVGGDTLPLRIYSMMKHTREMPVINALSTLLLVVTLALTTVAYRLSKPTARQENGRIKA